MKVKCDRSALADAVNVVGSVVASRTPSPVLQCIKLTAEDGVLHLAATDLEVGLRMPVESVDVEEPGSALVPADKLNQILRACDDDLVTIWTEETTIRITAGKSNFTVYGYDPVEAPTVRDFGEATADCALMSVTFQRLIRRTLFAAAAEHSRYAINGVLFNRDKKQIRMVATDGRRLAMARGECTSTGDQEKSSCIIPTKALNLISKLLNDPEDIIRLAIDGNQVVIAVGEDDGGAVLSSNLVEGSFPPFEDVIPKDQDKRVTFNPADLSSAIRRAALLTNDETKGVQMRFDNGKLTLISRAPEMGEAEIEMELDNYEGEPVEIGFNPGYLTDALKVVDDPKVMIELKAANKPGVIRTGNDFTYVVMPVSL